MVRYQQKEHLHSEVTAQVTAHRCTEWVHKPHFLKHFIGSIIPCVTIQNKTISKMHASSACSEEHCLLNIHVYSVSLTYLLESHRSCTCIQSLLQLCISDGLQTYAVGSLPPVLPPAPAAPVSPPWIDPITLSHLSHKWDLLLPPSLLCPLCSDTVGLHPGQRGHCLGCGHP